MATDVQVYIDVCRRIIDASDIRYVEHPSVTLARRLLCDAPGKLGCINVQPAGHAAIGRSSAPAITGLPLRGRPTLFCRPR